MASSRPNPFQSHSGDAGEGMDTPRARFDALVARACEGPLSLLAIEGLARDLGAHLDDSAEGADRHVFVTGDMTLAPIGKAAQIAGLRQGLSVHVEEGTFGAWRQDCLDPDGPLVRADADIVVIATGLDSIDIWPAPGQSADAIGALIEGWISDMERLWATVAAHSKARVIQHLLPPPPFRFTGLADRRAPWSHMDFVYRLNKAMLDRAPAGTGFLDLWSVATRVGVENWTEPRGYVLGRFGFDMRHLPAYALELERAWRGMTGTSRRALILDLDNTLWGGIIGDDGLEGIALGPGSARGEAFLRLNTYLDALRQRGIVLAICSKNDEQVARRVFDHHPHMPLDMADFGAVVCNWEDKATNLRHIAGALNLHPSSLVFADDNPAECALIRRELPEVAVIEMSGDPALFPERIDRSGLFEFQRSTEDDLKRAGSYGARRAAEERRRAATDLPSYLRSLEMVGRVAVAAQADLPRLAQMEQKTNQFNLTTRRYDEASLRTFMGQTNRIVLAVSLKDCFADHGLISSLCLALEGDTCRIDSWLMSCRVFSRTLPEFTLSRLSELLASRNVETVVGEVVATERNAVCRSIYEQLGFTREDEAGRFWRADLSVCKTLAQRSFIQGERES